MVTYNAALSEYKTNKALYDAALAEYNTKSCLRAKYLKAGTDITVDKAARTI